MSKELLESLNKKVVGLTDGEDFSDLVQMDVDTYAWFYEQAERVQELEESLERWQAGRNVAISTKRKVDKIEQQNKELAVAYNNAQKEIVILKNKVNKNEV